MIKVSSKYKLDMQVDCFHMANKQFDAERSREEKQLSYITVGAKLVDQRIEELNRDAVVPVFNSLNSENALDMYGYIVDKLSEKEFGTV